MPRIALIAFFFLLSTGLCGATGFIEPVPRVDEFRQEIGIYRSEVDLEAQELGFSDVTLKQGGIYLQAEMPFAEMVAGYVRVGAAKLTLEPLSSATVPTEKLDDDRYRPWAGVGFKGVLGSNPVVNLGYFAEGGYYSRYKDKIGTTNVEFDKYWDATAGLALQVQYKGVGAYVGPVVYFSNAELEIGSGATTISSYYRGDTQGMRAGVKIPFGSIAYLSLDGVFGDRTVWGGSLNIAGPGL